MAFLRRFLSMSPIVIMLGCQYDEPVTNPLTASTLTANSVSNYYVATFGSSANPGTFSQPWTLEYALQGAGGQIHAGDTVWVRGGATHDDAAGIYQGDPATPHRYVVSVSTGAPGAPIVFRTYQQ